MTPDERHDGIDAEPGNDAMLERAL